MSIRMKNAPVQESVFKKVMNRIRRISDSEDEQKKTQVSAQRSKPFDFISKIAKEFKDKITVSPSNSGTATPTSRSRSSSDSLLKKAYQ